MKKKQQKSEMDRILSLVEGNGIEKGSNYYPYPTLSTEDAKAELRKLILEEKEDEKDSAYNIWNEAIKTIDKKLFGDSK